MAPGHGAHQSFGGPTCTKLVSQLQFEDLSPSAADDSKGTLVRHGRQLVGAGKPCLCLLATWPINLPYLARAAVRGMRLKTPIHKNLLRTKKGKHALGCKVKNDRH